MKFNCGPTPAERRASIAAEAERLYVAWSQWHPNFAWWPTRVGSNDCRWLETIECRIAPSATVHDVRFYLEHGILAPIFEYRARQP